MPSPVARQGATTCLWEGHNLPAVEGRGGRCRLRLCGRRRRSALLWLSRPMIGGWRTQLEAGPIRGLPSHPASFRPLLSSWEPSSQHCELRALSQCRRTRPATMLESPPSHFLRACAKVSGLSRCAGSLSPLRGPHMWRLVRMNLLVSGTGRVRPGMQCQA